MGTRLYNGVVVVFWMTTMGWLLVDKVWPTLRVGDPPNYRAILNSGEDETPACWAIRWNDRPAGWASSEVVVRDDGMSEMQSRVMIAELPIDQIAPGWLGAVVKPVLRHAGRLDLDALTRIEIDPLDRLVGFESSVRLAHIADAVRVQGVVDNNRLKLTAQSGDLVYKTERYLAPEGLVGNTLSPQTRLPGLHVGQRWTMPTYSPLRPPNSPMEVIEVTVEQQEPVIWNGKTIQTLVVVYRSDSGSSLVSEPRGKLWVRPDGLVVRQDVAMLNSRLEFTRLGPVKSQELSAALRPYADREIPAHAKSRLMRLVSK